MDKSIERGDQTPDYSSLRADTTTGTPSRPSGPPTYNEDAKFNTSSDDEETDKSFYNPEPPASLLENSRDLFTADNIGDTVYSKHWLFSTLMDLIQAVESHATAREADDNVAFDVDENLQTELCKLWDMSMNDSVVAFLLEFKVSEILMGVLERSKAPRATEICLGIIGNMCCNEEAAGIIAGNEKLVGLILMHLNETDTPTLVETMRCLHTCVSSHAVRSLWCEAIRNEPTLYNNSRFILQSSTNTDLLKNAAQFVDEAMDVDEKICETWSTTDLVTAVLEGVNQFGVGHGDDLDSFFHILQLMSTNENGVVALVAEADAVSKVLLLHLVEACDDEIVGVLGRENFFASVFSVLNTILSGCTVRKALVQKDFQLMRCVLKTLDVVYPTVNKDSAKDVSRRYRRRRTTSSGQDSPGRSDNGKKASAVNGKNSRHDDSRELEKQEEFNESMLMMLYETMQSLLSNIIVICAKDAQEEEAKSAGGDASNSNADKAENSQEDSTTITEGTEGSPSKSWDTEEKDTKRKDRDEQKDDQVSATLTYMNKHCSRERLYFMIWALREKFTDDSSEGPNQFKLLQSAAKENKLERLTRILINAEDFL